MPAYYGFPQDNHAYTAAEVGGVLAGLVARDVNGVVREGVLGANPVVYAKTGWTVEVRPFLYVSKQNQTGVVIGGIDSATTLTVDAPPTSGSRIDVIAYDLDAVPPTLTSTPAEGTGEIDDAEESQPIVEPSQQASTTPGVVVVKGTGTKPVLASNLVELATVKITAGNASIAQTVITNTFAITAVEGAPIPFRTDSERALFKPRLGQECELVDAGKKWSCITPGSWRRLNGSARIPTYKWGYQKDPVYAVALNITLPTVLKPRENIAIEQITASGGYIHFGVRGVTRNASNTVVNLQFVRFGSPKIIQPWFVWRVIDDAGN